MCGRDRRVGASSGLKYDLVWRYGCLWYMLDEAEFEKDRCLYGVTK